MWFLTDFTIEQVEKRYELIEAELARKGEEIDRLCWIIQEAYDAKDRESAKRILGDVLKEDAVAAAIVRQARARGKIK